MKGASRGQVVHLAHPARKGRARVGDGDGDDHGAGAPGDGAEELGFDLVEKQTSVTECAGELGRIGEVDAVATAAGDFHALAWVEVQQLYLAFPAHRARLTRSPPLRERG